MQTTAKLSPALPKGAAPAAAASALATRWAVIASTVG
jgi:hypothetical protein